MWTRSARKPDGTFDIKVWGIHEGQPDVVETGFKSVRDAERRAEAIQRAYIFGEPVMSLEEVFTEMDNELLDQLFGDAK